MAPSLLSRLEMERLLHAGASDAECIRAIAERLIEELGISAPPVDLRMVASLLDIGSIASDPDLPAAGCLLCHPDGRFEIRVRSSDPVARQRFTIGHECGHTFFPGFALETQYRCSPSATARSALDVEGLCDVAAAELLFPRRLFVADSLVTTFGLPGLHDLSARYEGSVEATGHRLVAAWPEPCALLVFSERQKPSEHGTAAPERLRLDSAHTEGNWPYFPKHKSVVANDVFDRALQGEIVSEVTTISGVCRTAVRAEVHAQAYPLSEGAHRRRRVIALARQVEG